MYLRILTGFLMAFTLSACGGGATGLTASAKGAPTATTPPSTPTQQSTPLSLQGTPPASITVGNTYSFRPVVTPSSGVAFSIAGQPAWLTLNATTGALSGTPRVSDVGVSGAITLTASDGTSKATIGPFTMHVVATPTDPTASPPTIYGTPVTSVVAGGTYSFTPTTTDPSGGMLTFSVRNAPSWSTFNAATGQLSGSTTSSEVGSYANVTVSVTDGINSAALAPFSITVTQPQAGSAALSWTTPTQNTDGTPLTDLGGYYIDYGTTQTAMTQSVQVANPTASGAIIDNLAPGTWYFAVLAYTTSGMRSSISNIASKTI